MPTSFWATSMPITSWAARCASTIAAAKRGIDLHVGRPLGLSSIAAAWGIHEVVTAQMAQAARVVSVGKGKDPRRFAFVPFGGAGPVHGARLARMLGCPRIVFPHRAGVESAVGLLAAEPAFDLARTRITPLVEDTDSGDQSHLPRARSTGQEAAHSLRHRSEGARLRRSADMRFAGQGYEISVLLPSAVYRTADLQTLRDLFFDAYATTYGERAFDRNEAVEIVQFRLAASASPRAFRLAGVGRDTGDTAAARKPSRPVYFPETGGFTDCPVYDRYRLRAGDRFDGPALVEERESTVVILPASTAAVDADGNIIIDLSSRKEAQ